MKAKVFYGDDAEDLEDKINGWLEKNGSVNVVHATQTESGDFAKGDWGIVYTILYQA